MNLNNILWVYNTRKILPKAPVVENLFGKKLSNSGIITTATGNPVSIITNKAQNAISTLLSYSPKQSGSGDPSPQNIRPIEGWTEANLGVNSETPTITQSLGGTYYGFSVDVERGVLRVTKVSIAFSDIPSANWRYSNNGGTWNGYLFYTNLAERKRITTSICSAYKFTMGTEANVPANSYILPAWSTYLYIRDYSLTSIADFLTARGTERLVYELAEPITIPLTPQTVALLAGNNTIWTDGDSIEITYRR